MKTAKKFRGKTEGSPFMNHWVILKTLPQDAEMIVQFADLSESGGTSQFDANITEHLKSKGAAKMYL